MARPKRGTSPHSRRRHALQKLTELEARQAKIARSRPRTPGKKSWKTRRLKVLARQIAAARGQVTKALREIAQASRAGALAKSAAKQRRSEAARAGWAKRKVARKASTVGKPGRAMRFLEERGGEVKQILVDPPSKADRSAIGSYWYAIGVFRDRGSAALLDRFEGRTIYDARSAKHLPFVTNAALLLEAIASGLSDFDDLYSESASLSAA